MNSQQQAAARVVGALFVLYQMNQNKMLAVANAQLAGVNKELTAVNEELIKEGVRREAVCETLRLAVRELRPKSSPR